jgi:hypothetical protein
VEVPPLPRVRQHDDTGWDARQPVQAAAARGAVQAGGRTESAELMTRVAVIGTAGRKTAADRLDWLTFLLMRDAVLAELQNIPRPWELVSGAAAWADHVAVDLFLSGDVDRLELHLPCRFNGAIFYGDSDEARTANHYHQAFTARMPPGRSSFSDLREAIMRGATIWQYEVEGFKTRNYTVGRVDVVIAQTFGRGSVPADGGTKHCWDNSTAPVKIHIPIGELQKPAPAQQSLF